MIAKPSNFQTRRGCVFFTDKTNPYYINPTVQLTNLLRAYGHSMRKWVWHQTPWELQNGNYIRSKYYCVRTAACKHCKHGFMIQLPFSIHHGPDTSHRLSFGRTFPESILIFSFQPNFNYNVGLDYVQQQMLNDNVLCDKIKSFL